MYLVKRNKIYHLYFRNEKGVLVTHSTKCNNKADANKKAIEFIEKLKEPKPQKDNLTLGQFKSLYFQYASTRFTNNYQKFIEFAFGQFSKVVSPDILLGDINATIIERFIQSKLTEKKSFIINGYLRSLQGAFQRAVEFGYIQDNPFKKIKKLKFPQNEPLFITPNQFEKILLAENDSLYKLVYKLAICTGLRMAEIRFLKWESIDFDNNTIHIINHSEFTTKSKRSRYIPLHPAIKGELLAMKNQCKIREFVFTRNGLILTKDSLSCGFKKAVRLAELNDKIHFHSLRHTFASRLIQSGASLYVVSKLLGHADIKTTQIYSHLRSEDLRSAIDLLNE